MVIKTLFNKIRGLFKPRYLDTKVIYELKERGIGIF